MARGFTVIAHEVLTQEITCREELIWATPALTGLLQVYGGAEGREEAPRLPWGSELVQVATLFRPLEPDEAPDSLGVIWKQPRPSNTWP